MTAHIHAENMRLYAEDALTTDEPWLLWQWKDNLGLWRNFDSHSLTIHPSWYPEVEYRRKPRTININGFEVPEPLRIEPKFEEPYWIADPASRDLADQYKWAGHTVDFRWLQRGLLHLTKEAAELHAKALLSFTEKSHE